MTAGFSGYSALDWQLGLSALNTSFQALLNFRVSFETYAVILVGLPLYMTWCFFVAVFSILCSVLVFLLSCCNIGRAFSVYLTC